jgi:hypothetical protein
VSGCEDLGIGIIRYAAGMRVNAHNYRKQPYMRKLYMGWYKEVYQFVDDFGARDELAAAIRERRANES